MLPEDPRHGTVAGYNRIPCRDECCRRAHANYRKRLEWDRMNDRPRIVPALGVRRRMRALNRIGWSNAAIAAQAGMHPTNLTRLLTAETMTRALHDRLVAAYDALCDREPDGNRQAIALVRNRAERMGWPPPSAWLDIDDPDEQPDPGYRHTVYRAAELAAEWDHLRRAGVSIYTAASQLGVTVGAIEKAVERTRKDAA